MRKTESEPDLHWVALSLNPHIGAKTLQALQACFGTELAAVFAAPKSALLQVPGIGSASADAILGANLPQIARQMQGWQRDGLQILTPDDPRYPAPLRPLVDAPPTLFARGQLDAQLWQRAIAIVGTREPSPAARYIAQQLAMKLARAGCTVLSGLALGIDSVAHAAALAQCGRTVAVLGSGLLKVTPASNRARARDILHRGALLSELHPGWGPNAQRLVARNRIITGLSQALVVVESGARGGAMYAARFATRQGKAVFTFDLPAAGNQALLAAGAQPLPVEEPLWGLARFLSPAAGTIAPCE